MEENQENMTQEMDEALDAAWNESDVQADQPGADFQENQAEASPEPPCGILSPYFSFTNA